MKHLNIDEAKVVFEGLSIGFKEVESRMQMKRKHDKIIKDPDIEQHVIAYKIPEEYKVDSVKLYTDVNEETQQILQPYLEKAFELIKENTVSHKQMVLIMSSNWNGSKRHFKHLHTLLQGDRCNTFSLVFPLYIDENSDENHGFYWHYQKELYPKITYTSGERMEKVQREYRKTELAKSSITSLKFDSSRSIHYIDTTPHLYLWVVCDAVDFGETDIIEGLHAKIHDSFEQL